MPPGRSAPWHSWSAPLSLTWLAFEVLRCRPLLSIPSKVLVVSLDLELMFLRAAHREFLAPRVRAILLATHPPLPIDNLDLSHNRLPPTYLRPANAVDDGCKGGDRLCLSSQSRSESYRSKFSIGIVPHLPLRFRKVLTALRPAAVDSGSAVEG